MSSGRTARVEVRVTEGERVAIATRAARAQMSVSGYVRSRVLKNDDRARPDVDVAELRRTHADLKRAGSNVNQIARALNTCGASAISPDAIDRALTELSHAAAAASEILLSITR